MTGLTTKPRAMNYALDFCRGEIIGVWDAEDAPVKDQIEHVVSRFAQAPPEVVCLQGILDYYNPRTNWLARCFTIEYASWFRVVLPGIARMGLVVPLGGTTLFFRRDKLEELGGWDAHNVTEDADLGVRLCRAGYRTELIDTVTYEEANCRPWAWVKQRSRWLKGFMVTYLVHMRNPRQLLADLGPVAVPRPFRRFLSAPSAQFLLAPVLWSFWLILLGQATPGSTLVPQRRILMTMCRLFVAGRTDGDYHRPGGSVVARAAVPDALGSDDDVLFSAGRAGRLQGVVRAGDGTLLLGQDPTRACRIRIARHLSRGFIRGPTPTAPARSHPVAGGS